MCIRDSHMDYRIFFSRTLFDLFQRHTVFQRKAFIDAAHQLALCLRYRLAGTFTEFPDSCLLYTSYDKDHTGQQRRSRRSFPIFLIAVRIINHGIENLRGIARPSSCGRHNDIKYLQPADNA